MERDMAGLLEQLDELIAENKRTVPRQPADSPGITV
jgi:hypothetical protein